MAMDTKNAVRAMLYYQIAHEQKKEKVEEKPIDTPAVPEGDIGVFEEPEVWKLDGAITPKYIKILIENDIESFEDILGTEFQAMVDIDGIGKLTAGKIYDAVEEMLKETG